jgi:hypothetical protein
MLFKARDVIPGSGCDVHRTVSSLRDVTSERTSPFPPQAPKRTNAAFLISAWSVLYLDRTPEEAFRPFRGIYPPFPPFHDASPCVCTFNLSILDCLKGLAKARYYKFFDFNRFNVEEYEYYEQVRAGEGR